MKSTLLILLILGFTGCSTPAVKECPVPPPAPKCPPSYAEELRACEKVADRLETALGVQMREEVFIRSMKK